METENRKTERYLTAQLGDIMLVPPESFLLNSKITEKGWKCSNLGEEDVASYAPEKNPTSQAKSRLKTENL